jgi:predicted AlkP superfamily phosphohydrolase/phosphomutase
MSSESGGSSPRRVVLLGIDGLASSFLEAPLVAINMPNLRSLLRQATMGPLHSTLPAYTGPAWTSITTGVNPGRHGVFGFTDSVGRPTSDSGVTAARIWDYVGQAGGRSIVVNVPLTHPPRPIAGCLVSGMPVPPDTPFTYPAELAGDLEDYVPDIAVQEGQRESIATLHRLARMTAARGRAVTRLARFSDWDFLAVIFVLPDRLGHPWWKQLVPGDRLYDTLAAQRVRRHAHASIVALDNAIGDLLAALPPHTAIVLCSDHGFGPLRAEVFFDLVLAREGLISNEVASLRRLVARVGRSRLARLAPRSAYHWVKARASSSGQGRVGISSPGNGRRAWTAPSFESGVRLADPSDLKLRARVSELLRDLRANDGGPVVRAVHAREDVYEGPQVEKAPDLLCEMVEESVCLHEGLHADQAWISREDLPWGTHTREGIIAISGAEVGEGLCAEAPDVAATVLSLLGVGVEGLDGRSLVHPIAPTHHLHAGSPPGEEGGSEAYTAEQEAAVMEHLKGLGYVD